MSTRHVVLITYGEPPAPAFGPQLKYSWRILLGLTRAVADIPAWLLPIIAVSRARLRKRMWSDEGYESPLEPITADQAKGLEAALAARRPEVTWRVRVAYEFRDPLLVEVLNALPEDEPVDIVPMYAADSAFTHEISRATLEGWLARRPAPRPAPVRVLPAMDPEVLAEVSARHIENEMTSRHVRGGKDCGLVLAAHGTLLEPPRPIETGREATERLCQAIARRMTGAFGSVVNGWLNHTYGGRWTEPPVNEALKSLVERGFERVVYYPYGFLADNAESQLEGRIALRDAPALESVHLACVNASSEFLEALAEQVIEEASERGAKTALSGSAAR